MDVRIGILTPGTLDERARDALAAAGDAGLDHVGSVDHVSFRGGDGVDSLVTVAAMAGLHPTLGLHTSVYLLTLRHPVVVARQLSTVAHMAPGRLVFGVGIGGEDRHEVEVCGIDPRTRGRRMDEHLTVLRALLTGEPVTFHGEFVSIDEACIQPAPPLPIPIVVGGRSDAAARRAGRLGEGWVGVWNSARRFADVMEIVGEEADRVGRGDVEWCHAQTVWCAFGPNRDAVRDRLATKMEHYYGLPFDSFEKYTPYGRPEDVAEFLVPYVEAGAGTINAIAVAAHLDEAIEGVAALKELLVS
ncbi:MAG: LLM class flavin-dependent oxidoreductase [Actinobacteria bacterium]|nr:LLM class flavin-dependent oxidoreductase [Actinomycetota bacterium]